MTKTRTRTAILKNEKIMCPKCSEQCLPTEDIKYETDDPIECDGCHFWLHRKCLDKRFNKKEWETLTGENQSIKFKCNSCLLDKGDKVSDIRAIRQMLENSIQDNKKMMQEMKEQIYAEVDKVVDDKIKSMNTRTNEIEEKLHSLDKKYEERFNRLEKEMKEKKGTPNKVKELPTQANLEQMVKEVKSTEVNLEKKIKDEVKCFLVDQQEKDNRKNNLIILKMKEYEITNKEEYIERDRAELKKLFEVTTPELAAEMETILKQKHSFRLGIKKPNEPKPRPIRITLPDEQMKIMIFKGCKHLKDSAFSHVSIQNDLNKVEQEKAFQLRKQLRERKIAGEDVCIFRNEIILRADHPKNQKKKEEDKKKEDQEKEDKTEEEERKEDEEDKKDKEEEADKNEKEEKDE